MKNENPEHRRTRPKRTRAAIRATQRESTKREDRERPDTLERAIPSTIRQETR